jgi:hypothetical protein
VPAIQEEGYPPPSPVLRLDSSETIQHLHSTPTQSDNPTTTSNTMCDVSVDRVWVVKWSS